MKSPAPATDRYALAGGAFALAPGFAFLSESRTLVAADAHFAYEEVIGGALPLWSTNEIVALLLLAIRRTEAREVVFLGDIVHGPRMSEGAARVVRAGLAALRAEAVVTLVAGNHEGRSRAFSVLGETVTFADRDGWHLVHGDGVATFEGRTMIGHLHPSLRLGPSATAPAFVASERFIVLPALNPYSPGLDLCSDEFGAAIGRWNVQRKDAHVVAVSDGLVYPFGSLSTLRETLRAPHASRPALPAALSRFCRKLRPG